MTKLQEQIKEALKFARGNWQKGIIKQGFAVIDKSMGYWAERYKKSLFNLCHKLNEAEIDAEVFAHPTKSIYYVVIGKEWLKLFNKVAVVMSSVSSVYAQLKERKFSAEVEKELRKIGLMEKLRSLLTECNEVFNAVGDCYSKSLRGFCDPQKAYNEATQLVEELERPWNEMKSFVGVLFL
jgi:hypothetical protein